VDKFLAQYGLHYEEFPITDDNAPVGYHFILGISPRGGEHAIVGKDGRPVWDSHPASDGTGQGLVKPEKYGVLIPVKSKAKDARVDEDAAELARVYKAQGDAVARKLWAEKTKGLNYGQQVILQDKMSRLIKQSKVADTDPRAGVTKCQQCGTSLNGDDVAEVNGKVVCPDCADRRARLHRALDCVMDKVK
jgi:DNA-directed RNA polymerase subunit RPC12/RpoP